VLFGGLITANSRRRPPSSAQLGTSIANVRLMSAAKEDSCSRSGERLNPVNRLGSPLDKESRKPRKHFRLFHDSSLAVRNPHRKGCCFPGTRSVTDRSVAPSARKTRDLYRNVRSR
jgi:hypothetical protein